MHRTETSRGGAVDATASVSYVNIGAAHKSEQITEARLSETPYSTIFVFLLAPDIAGVLVAFELNLEWAERPGWKLLNTN